MNDQKNLPVQALQWCHDTLKILDQRVLPGVIKYANYNDAEGVAEAISAMQVRGAPAIGIAAAYAVYLSVKQHYTHKPADWQQAVQNDIKLLAATRPTAVNLCWALQCMQAELEKHLNDPLPALLARAKQIHQEDIDANLKMGELGADLLGEAEGILTHCNAGALATGGYGTALGVIRSAWQRSERSIYATETRPWRQGARLTAWELQADGISTTLIADSAAAWLMKAGKIDWLIVGADRIAANGDVANKIGTYALAVLAKQHAVKMMVVAPTSSIDAEIEDGDSIAIEQRDSSELLDLVYQDEVSLVQAWNPVFDVTPAELINAIVTESGVVINPKKNGVRSLIK